MPPIQLSGLSVNFDDRFRLTDINWRIEPGQHWVIIGPNGAGKSALAAVLGGAGEIEAGTLDGLPERVAVVSFEAQAVLIEAELKKDDADILDVISEGTPAAEMLAQPGEDRALRESLVDALGFAPLCERAFRKLSTGETRKLLLIRALASGASLVVLDEPFEGLDAGTVDALREPLRELSQRAGTVLVLNHLDDVPDWVTHFAFVDEGQLVQTVDRAEPEASQIIEQLLHLRTTELQVPPPDPGDRRPALDPAQPLVRLRDARVAYGDKVIFEGLDWTIAPGEHWQLSGPNGSGKTCLLNLITGDHPQCYVNDIFVFGMQRGQGESIWDVKRHIGYVSSALQWEYRVSANLEQVVISGFFDSIGVYQRPSDQQREIAAQWLALLGLADRARQPFNQLSFGDRRLLLIARAMVKHPPLLILDEPCLGLDAVNRHLVMALIERLCEEGDTAVLYVNHRVSERIPGIDRHLALGVAQ